MLGTLDSIPIQPNHAAQSAGGAKLARCGWRRISHDDLVGGMWQPDARSLRGSGFVDALFLRLVVGLRAVHQLYPSL